jgi:hypothetical protein
MGYVAFWWEDYEEICSLLGPLVESRIRGGDYPFQRAEHRNFLILSPTEAENGNHFGNAVISFK